MPGVRNSWAASWQRFFSNRGYGIRRTSARDKVVGAAITLGLLGSMVGAVLLLGWLLGR